MSSFDGIQLFESGPHRFDVGGLELRHAQQEAPDWRGVRVTGQGVAERAIAQKGTLLADSPAALRTLTDAIEAKLDGRAHELVDHLGRAWQDVVMLRFEPAAARRFGTRWGCDYRIDYAQVTP